MSCFKNRCGCENFKQNPCLQTLRGERGATGPAGPAGERGATGLSGEGKISASYIVTLRSPDFVIPNGGFEVPSRGRLPLRQEVSYSVSSPVTLYPDEGIIMFNEKGVYEVEFIANGYTKKAEQDFDLNGDFSAVGFRKIDSDEVLIGANDWSYNEVPHNIVGHGIVVVENENDGYELVNLKVTPLYILGGRKELTMTSSYMITPVVSMIIKKID